MNASLEVNVSLNATSDLALEIRILEPCSSMTHVIAQQNTIIAKWDA